MKIKFKARELKFVFIFLASIYLSIRLISRSAKHSVSVHFENRNKIINFSYHECENRPATNTNIEKYIRYECADANQKCGGLADR